MPQVQHAAKKSIKPRIVGVVVICLVVAAAAGVALYMSKQKSDKQSIAETRTVIRGSMDKSFSGDNDSAIASIKSQLARAKTDDEKLELNLALGSAYEGKDDNASALEAYKAAYTLHPGFGTGEAVARTAEAAGNKALALEHLKRNLERIKSGEAFQHEGEEPGIEAAIKRLEGGA